MTLNTSLLRRFPIGCETSSQEASVRLWAPAARRVALVTKRDPDHPFPLTAEPHGYFSATVPLVTGDLYRLRLDDSPDLLPDPVSRFQPSGPFGWSQVIDPEFLWTDSSWPGIELRHQVLYELHIGTFTQEGTWEAATRELAQLAELGITVIEVMPVADFAGRFGWGYDGVNLFAPTHLYGTPDAMRRFVNAAHGLGMAVILDVVYNHLGPTGNFLTRFAPHYFHPQQKTDWGEAINFDGPDSDPVREFYCTNAAYWISEFHLDGLRLDATQDIYDRSSPHIIQELAQAARQAAGHRSIIVTAENEPQHTHLVRPVSDGGYELDGLWNDDFHHSARVALTGRNEAYYTDYLGRAQELASAVKYGYLFQGQHYSWQKKPRGTPGLDLPPHRFITYLQNHDQVANSAHGLRLHAMTSPGRWRAMTALLLLGPGTPLLFQGQEFNVSSPFLYFADHGEDLAPVIAGGRQEFLSQFRSIATPEARQSLHEPADETTFHRCKLNTEDRARHAATYQLHRELLRIRHHDPVIHLAERSTFDAADLNERILLLRYFGPGGSDRLLLVNLGRDWEPHSIANPLIAPPLGTGWEVQLSTEEIRFGGGGAYNPCHEGKWRIPGEAAVLLQASTDSPHMAG